MALGAADGALLAYQRKIEAEFGRQIQSFSASLQKSPVFDEPAHIASGLFYIETGVFHGNLQHPPLLREMSAIFLSMAGIHWPSDEMAH
jgi:hypothetical protein